MDIDNPDPGTSPRVTFVVETPLDSEILAFATGDGPSAAAEVISPVNDLEAHASSPSSQVNPVQSKNAEGGTSDQVKRSDEDTQMADPGQERIKDNIDSTAALDEGSQDPRSTDSLPGQDTRMSDQSHQSTPANDQAFPHSSFSTNNLTDSNDTSMSEESSMSLGRGSRNLSDENRSPDTSVDSLDHAGDFDAPSEHPDTKIHKGPTATSLYSSYLPPQPYGFSPYPPVAEASISGDVASTKPLPPSPTITYASTEDLDQLDVMDLDAQNAGSTAAPSGANLAKAAEPVSSSVPTQVFDVTSRLDDHSEAKLGEPPVILPRDTDPATSSTASSGSTPFNQAPPQSSFGTHVTYGYQSSWTHDKNYQDHLDLLPRIKGLFRLLDLYSETTSSGLVDKIIISQASLGRFINTILPGAYTSVTKIDFNRLDRDAQLPLIGIYGSKSEIVRFLQAAGSIDDDVTSEPDSDPPTRYVIYWPQSETWDGSSGGSIRKNRVTFMRYLTCLTDQLRCLISPEHENSLVFDDADDDSDDDAFQSTWGAQDDGKVNDRFFKFEVAKTNEKEEGAEIRDGFTIEHHILNHRQASLPNGRPLTLEPRLLSGETIQAVATLRFIPGADMEEGLNGTYTPFYLKSELKRYNSITIPDTMEEAELEIMLEKCDLGTRVPLGVTRAYKKALEELHSQCDSEARRITERCLQDIKEGLPKLEAQTRLFLIDRLLDIYTSLDWDVLFPEEKQPTYSETEDPLEYFHVACAGSPLVREALDGYMTEHRLETISLERYRRLKRPFLIVLNILDKHTDLTDEKREILVQAITQEDSAPNVSGPSTTGWAKFNPLKWGRALLPKLGFATEDVSDSLIKSYSQVEDRPDPKFLSSLNDAVTRHPLLAESADSLRSLAIVGLREKIGRRANSLALKLNLAYERQLKQQCEHSAKTRKQIARTEAFASYRRDVQAALTGNGTGPALNIVWAKEKYRWGFPSEVEIKALTRRRTDPTIGLSLWTLDLPEDDKRRLHDDPSYVPAPRIPQWPPLEQPIPLNWEVRRVQMIGPRRCLLVIDTPGKTRIWIFSPQSGPKLEAPTYQIALPAERKYVIAVDEQKRVLAFVVMSQALEREFSLTSRYVMKNSCVLQQYTIESDPPSIRSRGSPFDLKRWYDDTVPDIAHAAFFSGTDDLCLVESWGRIRILSTAQQNFRPATIQLDACPLFVRSSPDGSALLVLEGVKGNPATLRVFHHASFGSNTTGIVNVLPSSFTGAQSFSVTSIGERGRVFVMGLKPSTQAIVSVCVDISRKETEYQFRAKVDSSKSQSKQSLGHNELITCFSEVWERFPVVAAIQRETISPATRQPSSLTFVCESPNRPFASYFRQMVRTFEETSKKPTGQCLANIHVSSSIFDDLEWENPSSSNFKAGEWIVELLCLIPIHIAVANENRFTPLKDGVLDPRVERELLGASVSRIIDSISLGWYESIFSAYMASKPVKVISSMGVHSIERTPQEDMLLVLFNTALSNLIIFRNNFALSRDVANMFTSFQSSTHLFDPKSNPKLFKGLLAIVIKDVVDADKKDIVKEFSSKFGQIVSKEQASNFITVLHNSQLTVIPWSVILSADFYRLFGKLGKTLFNQETTHDTAGEFLITLKTLMAKMKAQDWGSLDQTVIKHRVAALTGLLPRALTHGRLGFEAEDGQLTNMDNQNPIPGNDSSAVFYLLKDDKERATSLANLITGWNPDAARYPTEDLSRHLQDIASQRISKVREWIQQNVSRFPQDNADMRSLKRQLEDLSEALLANIQLCLAECSTSTIVEPLTIVSATATTPTLMTALSAVDFNAILRLTYVASRVHSVPAEDVRDIASSQATTTTQNTCVLQEFIFVERQATVFMQSAMHTALVNAIIRDLIFTVRTRNAFITARQNAKIVAISALSLSVGHPQAEHNTAHGSMELTAWAVEGNNDAVIEVHGRRFAAQDNGAPQLCSSICTNLGRHAHIDYCRTEKGQCREEESEHITPRMLPNLDRPKDWISHKVFWARTGFRDPYSVDEQAEFRLCNVECAGPEHEAVGNAPARPSYCTLPIFHPPQPLDWNPAGNASYVSNDGHSFACPNPNNLRQSFHVMFVLDRSGSMGSPDRRPLPGQPVSATITAHNNNRFGAVLSAVYGFWVSRGSGNQGARRDAYSVITFQSSAAVRFANDLTRTPEQMLNVIVQEQAGGGTNFDAALRTAQATMETHWSTERSPVLIFLSDGECRVSDPVIHDLCNRAVARGRMVTVAEQVATNAPRDPLTPLVPCGYTDAMDTIRLAETFLNIADSLKKPRAALLRS
ncbi:hypothetical protein FRC00_005051 [Tulasnella sp. 408]|nr:hypothetical protein FRC00_005051 [Tulasnella sp. 408]